MSHTFFFFFIEIHIFIPTYIIITLHKIHISTILYELIIKYCDLAEVIINLNFKIALKIAIVLDKFKRKIKAFHLNILILMHF